MPLNATSNFDQVVTQWMSPVYVDLGSCWTCCHVQVVGRSTNPSTRMVHESRWTFGVASAVRTGQPPPTSY